MALQYQFQNCRIALCCCIYEGTIIYNVKRVPIFYFSIIVYYFTLQTIITYNNMCLCVSVFFLIENPDTLLS